MFRYYFKAACSFIEKSHIFYGTGSGYESETNLSSKTSGNICNALPSMAHFFK